MTKILLVDDEESIRNMMRMTLELDGFHVLMAEDGPTALDVFKRESPEIVLLDVRMPGMDGVEVLSRIKEMNRDAEVIIISGHGNIEACRRARALKTADGLLEAGEIEGARGIGIEHGVGGQGVVCAERQRSAVVTDGRGIASA